MDDELLLRYSRHILLPEIGIEGQQRIGSAHALVIGAGGLGSPIALYLAAAGFGRITIGDPDTVDLTNLQRQIAHTTASVGERKVDSARRAMRALNPQVEVSAVPERLAGAALEARVAAADIVLDASDNFPTRHAINRACVAHRRPLVSGAAIRFEGQIAVFDARRADSPCYECLFPEAGEPEDLRCAVMGVYAPLTGIVGTIQAAEAIKLAAGIGAPLTGRLLLIDAHGMDIRTVRVQRDPHCRVCGPTAR
jgi:adenylyltransferase/sulfurtransferase